MSIHKLTVISLLMLVLLTSCKPNFKKIFIENNENFELHRTALNKVIVDIENKHLLNWSGENFVIPTDSMSGPTKNILRDLGVECVEIKNNSNNNCDKNYSIILVVREKWNIETLRVVRLIYAPCDAKTVENYHYYEGYNIDFWGQGGSWFIFSDSDFT